MPLYRYKAVNGAGATVPGEYDAAQEMAVIDWLRESALMPLKVELAKARARARAPLRARRKRAALLVRAARRSRRTSCSTSRASWRRC